MKRPAVFGSSKQPSSSCGITATSNKARTVQNSADLSPLLSSRLRDKTPNVSSKDIAIGKNRSAKVHVDVERPDIDEKQEEEKEEKEQEEKKEEEEEMQDEEKDCDVEIGRKMRNTSFTAWGGVTGVSQRISDRPLKHHFESPNSDLNPEIEDIVSRSPSPIQNINDNATKV